MRMTISVTAIKRCVRHNNFGCCLKIGQVYTTNSKQALWVSYDAFKGTVYPSKYLLVYTGQRRTLIDKVKYLSNRFY